MEIFISKSEIRNINRTIISDLVWVYEVLAALTQVLFYIDLVWNVRNAD